MLKVNAFDIAMPAKKRTDDDDYHYFCCLGDRFLHLVRIDWLLVAQADA
jgi:hypothetical protein